MPSNILCIDTSRYELLVLLISNNKIFYKTAVQVKKGDNLILEYIRELLQEQKLSIKDLTYLVYVAGPGSFTGLRIGVSVIQALNLVYNTPVIGISRLQLLAEQAYQLIGAKRIVVSMNALRDEYFFGEYYFDEDSTIMQPLIKDCLYTKNELVDKLVSKVDKFAIVSDSLDILSLESSQIINACSSEVVEQDLKALSNIALYNEVNNIRTAAFNILPKYLKQPHITKH